MSEAQNGAGRWRDRTVGYGTVKADQLLANPNNWRVHPKHQQDALLTVLDKVGWVDDVIVNQRTGCVVDGHLRVSLAISNDEDVPVKYVDLSEDEEGIILATFDTISAMAATDPEMLSSLMAHLRESDLVQENPAIHTLLQGVAKQTGAEYATTDPPDAPDAEVDRAEELRDQWGTAPGQLWELPSVSVPGRCHRLLCGDSTNPDDVARLMQGERFSFLMTDPPYNVDYGHKNVRLNLRDGGHRIQTAIEHDKMTLDQWGDFLRRAFGALRSHGHPGAAYYICGPAGENHLMFLQALADSGFAMRHTLIWAKNNHVLGGSDYNYKHEPIIYGWLEGAAHRFYGSASETTLWEVDKPMANKLHPTMKPVELYIRALLNSSTEGDVVVDHFAGSGPLMIAAEQYQRIAYCIELAPEYVAVILQRMAALGLTPRLVE